MARKNNAATPKIKGGFTMKKLLSIITSFCLCALSVFPASVTAIERENVPEEVSIVYGDISTESSPMIYADEPEFTGTTGTTTTTGKAVSTTTTTVNYDLSVSYEGESVEDGGSIFVPFDTDVTLDFESKGDVSVSDYILKTEQVGSRLDIDNDSKQIDMNIASGSAVKVKLYDSGSNSYFTLNAYGMREYIPVTTTSTTSFVITQTTAIYGTAYANTTVTTTIVPIGMVDNLSGTVSVEQLPTKRVYSTSDTQLDLSGASVKIDLDRALFGSYIGHDSITAELTDMPFQTDVLQVMYNYTNRYDYEKLDLYVDTSEVDLSTPGTYPVIVHATVEKIPATIETWYKDLELSTSFDIVVQAPDTTPQMCSSINGSIYIKSLPDKLNYKVGDSAVDLSGGVIDIYVEPEFPDGNRFYFDYFYYNMEDLPYVSTVPIIEDHTQQAEVRAWADDSSVDFSTPGTYPVYLSLIVPELGFEKQITFDVTVSEIVTGDANGDDEISVSDPVLISQYLANADDYPMTAEQRKAADVIGNGDGLTSADALQLQRYLAGLSATIEANAGLTLEKANILTAELEANEVEGLSPDADFTAAQEKFAVDMFKSCYSGENTIVSPYSAMEVLAMTANGADGDTRSQMETALGGLSIDRLNRYLYTFRNSLPTGDRVNVRVANSIWEREGCIETDPDFLQNVVDYYGAEVAEAPFDESTVRDINSWISNKTNGLIKEMINELSPLDMMCLINTVLLDAKWERGYWQSSILPGDFTTADGAVQTAQYLSDAEYIYLEDSEATGFIKYYEGGKLGFAAILPNEDISIDEYVSGLTGEKLNALLEDRKIVCVDTKLPKFEYDSFFNLGDTLKSMGMTDAFDSSLADFSGIGKVLSGYDLCIGTVLQTAHIDLNEEGTTAAAATMVVLPTSVPIPECEVTLDRPFVYAIIDMETNVPLFMGAVTSVE